MQIVIPKIKNKGETCYFLAFVLYIFCAFYNTTTFKAIVDISTFYNVVRILAIVLIAVKCIYLDRYTKHAFVLILLFLGIGALSVLESERSAIFDFLILMVGAHNIEPRKLIRTHFMIAAPFLLIAFICSNLGLIVDYTITRSGSDALRHSFGILYTTDFAAHVFFAVLSGIYLKRKEAGLADAALSMLFAGFIYVFCDARLSTVMLILTPVMFLLMQKFRFFQTRSWAKIVGICGFFLSGLVIVLTMRYSVNNSTMVWIDENLFNGRLYIAKNVIDTYGFSPFGQRILMQGDGYKTYTYNATIGTTYIDSAYLQIALLYGTVFLVILLIGIFVFAVSARKDARMVMCIFLILLSCVHNQYLIAIAYNPFILTMGYYFFGSGRRIRLR